jgi:hypothetical protein
VAPPAVEPTAMHKQLFQLLARLNKLLLPKLWDKDLNRLTPFQKGLVAWRYWVTCNALGN